MSKQPLSKIAGKAALGVSLSALIFLPAAAAQEAAAVKPEKPAVKTFSSAAVDIDYSSPQSVLTLYINGLNLPGWKPEPFYMWTYEPPPPAPPAAPGNSSPGVSSPGVSSPGVSSTGSSGISSAAPPPSAVPGGLGSASSLSTNAQPDSGRSAISSTAPPAASAVATAAKAAGQTQSPAAGGQTPAAASSPSGPRSVHGAQPALPDGDTARQSILDEYRLTGFFRKQFSRGHRSIYIDVYDFESPEGAYGAYNYLRKGSTTALPRGDAASEDGSSISLVQGKTFFSIYGSEQDDDEIREVLIKIANQAVVYIGDRGLQPGILQRLPIIDKVQGSEKIVMGPNSIRRFYPAPYVGSFSVENGRAVGCVADYQLQEPVKERLKLLILSFKTPLEAYSNYTKFLTQITQAHDSGDVSTLAQQPINLFKTGSSYIAIACRGSDLMMITGARKRYSPALVLHQVR